MAKLLECVEHGHEMGVSDTVYVARVGRKSVAFCEPLLRRIPDGDRSPHRSPDMIDIHAASATADHYHPGKLSHPSLKVGKLLFSVPRDALKKHLPRVSERLAHS